MFASVAQSVEQRTENPRVGGSIPPQGTIYKIMLLTTDYRVFGYNIPCWCGSTVEQLTCNQQVNGSSPFIGFNGWIPEWPKGTDCKSAGTAFEGSNPSPPTLMHNLHQYNIIYLVNAAG